MSQLRSCAYSGELGGDFGAEHYSLQALPTSENSLRCLTVGRVGERLLLLGYTSGSSLLCLGDRISEEECYPDWRVCWRISAWNGFLGTTVDSSCSASLSSSSSSSNVEVSGSFQQVQPLQPLHSQVPALISYNSAFDFQLLPVWTVWVLYWPESF